MAAGGWNTAQSISAAAPRPAAAFDLRPLTLGEVLDRTFAVYRSRFWLFAGISMASGSVQLIVNGITLVVHHFVLKRFGFVMAQGATGVGNIIGSILFLLAASVTQAGTVWAMSEVYLGKTASIMESLRATAGKWYRYVGIVFWQAWSAAWVGMLLFIPAMVLLVLKISALAWLGGALMVVAIIGGGVYGVIAYLRNSLAVQAAVIEQLTVRASMRRSKVLADGTKGRIFVVLLITFCLYSVAGMFQMPLVFLFLKDPQGEHALGQAIILLISFAAHTLVAPVAMIGLSLVYFDQRVRKEALDIVMLMGGDSPVMPAGGYATGGYDPGAGFAPARPFAYAGYPPGSGSGGYEPAAAQSPAVGSFPATSAGPFDQIEPLASAEDAPHTSIESVPDTPQPAVAELPQAEPDASQV